MGEQPLLGSGPLTQAEAEQIESTLLPNLDRHHLRLLAHCLRCFQDMASPRQSGPLPSQSTLEQWLLAQPQLADDAQFRDLLLLQLQTAAHQLEEIARSNHHSALELSIPELIEACTKASKARINNQRTAPANCDHPTQESSSS